MTGADVLSVFEQILEVEINPYALFAEGQGCLALDAVIVAREKTA